MLALAETANNLSGFDSLVQRQKSLVSAANDLSGFRPRFCMPAASAESAGMERETPQILEKEAPPGFLGNARRRLDPWNPRKGARPARGLRPFSVVPTKLRPFSHRNARRPARPCSGRQHPGCPPGSPHTVPRNPFPSLGIPCAKQTPRTLQASLLAQHCSRGSPHRLLHPVGPDWQP